MDNVFEISDPIVKEMYPDNILVDESGNEIILGSDENITESDSEPAVLAEESDSTVSEIVSGVVSSISPELGLIIDGIALGNDLWDLFLDTFSVPDDGSANFDSVPSLYYISSRSEWIYNGGGNASVFYALLKKGYTYHFNGELLGNTYARSIAFSDVPPVPNSTPFTFYSSFPAAYSFDITPSKDEYIIFSFTGLSQTPSPFTYEGFYEDSYTLSEVGASLVNIDNTLIKIENDIRMVNTFGILITVCFLARSIVRKLFWRY